MTTTWTLILLIAAGALSAFGVVRSNGKSEIAWAILLTDLALLIPRMPGR